MGTGVFFVEGGAVNWTILRDGADMTLIDAGYPGDHADVLASLRQVGGSLEKLQAILVTHAHIDHIGSIPALLEHRPVPVLTGAREAAHTRREFLEQATPLDVAANLLRPGMLGWTAHIVSKGALSRRGVPSATAVTEGVAAPVPGAPVPLLVPGHTSGHTCYVLPQSRALVTGDALATGHRLSAAVGPQLLPAFFDHDRAQAERSLQVIAKVDADLLLPGHGAAARVSPTAAVAQALARP